MDNKFVYVMPRCVCYGTRVVNLDVNNIELNNFLAKFHIWGNCGEYRITNPKSAEYEREEIWYEMPKDFYDMINNDSFKLAFEKMGVKLVFDYPN